MALTEEQREIVESLWFTRDTNSKSGFTSSVEAVVSAFSKPEPVGRGWLDPISGKLVCAAPDGSALLYSEAPIAQPASAPSEQKPAAWLNPVDGSVISDSHRIYLLENYPKNKCEHVEPLYLAPQPDYKAQRDAERYRWLKKFGAEAVRKAGDSFPTITLYEMHLAADECWTAVADKNNGFEEALDSAIASAKGGE